MFFLGGGYAPTSTPLRPYAAIPLLPCLCYAKKSSTAFVSNPLSLRYPPTRFPVLNPKPGTDTGSDLVFLCCSNAESGTDVWYGATRVEPRWGVRCTEGKGAERRSNYLSSESSPSSSPSRSALPLSPAPSPALSPCFSLLHSRSLCHTLSLSLFLFLSPHLPRSLAPLQATTSLQAHDAPPQPAPCNILH